MPETQLRIPPPPPPNPLHPGMALELLELELGGCWGWGQEPFPFFDSSSRSWISGNCSTCRNLVTASDDEARGGEAESVSQIVTTYDTTRASLKPPNPRRKTMSGSIVLQGAFPSVWGLWAFPAERLHALHPDDKDELGDDVQHDPSHSRGHCFEVLGIWGTWKVNTAGAALQHLACDDRS